MGKKKVIDGTTGSAVDEKAPGEKEKQEERMNRIKAKAKKSATKSLEKVTADDFDPQVIADMLGLPVSVFYDGQGK